MKTRRTDILEHQSRAIAKMNEAIKRHGIPAVYLGYERWDEEPRKHRKFGRPVRQRL